MIDYHCHLLPGLDDGSRLMEQTIELCEQEVLWGFATVVCTPHINRRHHNTPASIRG